jgi:hypothetical protein
MGGPNSSYAATSILLRILWPRKPHHYVRVRAPSGANKILGSIKLENFLISLQSITSLKGVSTLCPTSWWWKYQRLVAYGSKLAHFQNSKRLHNISETWKQKDKKLHLKHTNHINSLSAYQISRIGRRSTNFQTFFKFQIK